MKDLINSRVFSLNDLPKWCVIQLNREEENVRQGKGGMI